MELLFCFVFVFVFVTFFQETCQIQLVNINYSDKVLMSFTYGEKGQVPSIMVIFESWSTEKKKSSILGRVSILGVSV